MRSVTEASKTRARLRWLALTVCLAGLTLPALAQGGGTPSAQGMRVVGGMGGVTRAMVTLPDGVLLAEGDALLQLDETGRTLRRVLPGRGQVQDLIVRSGMVYLLTEQGLALLEMADLVERGFLPGGGQALAVADSAVYVAARQAGIRVAVFDRRDGLRGPWREIVTPAAARDLAVDPAGRVLFVALGEAGVALYDLADPAQPQLAAQLADAVPASTVTIEAGRLLVGCDYRLLIYSLVDPLTPRLLSIYDPLHDGVDILLRREWAYIADRAGGLKRYNIADLRVPRWEDVVWPGTVYALADDERYVYAAAGWEGVLAFDAGRLDALSLRARALIPGQATAIALGGDRAGRWAVAGMAEVGLAVIDWRDMDRPVVLATLDLGGTVRDLAVRGTIGLAALEEGEIVLVSLTRLESPRIVARLSLGGTPQAIALDGTLAYVAAGEAGLYVLGTTRPLSPVVLGHFPPPQEALPVTGVTLEGGKRLYLSAGAALVIVDVGAPDDPQLLATLPIPAKATAARNFIAYAVGGPALTTVNVSSSNAPEVLGRYIAVDTIRAVAGRGDRAWVAGEGTGAAALGLALDAAGRPQELLAASREGQGVALDWMADGTLLLAQADGTLLRLDEAGPVTLRVGLPTGLALNRAGDGLLALGGQGWAVLDVADPQRPVILQTGDAPGMIESLVSVGPTTWLALGEQGIRAVGARAGRWQPDTTAGATRQLVVEGGFLYAAEDGPGQAGSLRILTTDPLGTVTAVPLPGPAQSVASREGQVYTGYRDGENGAGGLAVIDVSTPMAGLEVAGQIAAPADDLAVLPGGRIVYSVRGTTLSVFDTAAWPTLRIASAVTLPVPASRLALLDTRYLAALQPGQSGLLLDLRDPWRPVPVAALPVGVLDAAGGSAALYLAAGSSGLQVVSLATLADLAMRLVSVDPTPATALWTGGGWLYAAGGGKLRLYNLADSLSPVLMASVDLPGTVTDRLVVHETRRDGRWLYLGATDGVQVIHHAADGSLIGPLPLADRSSVPLAAAGSWLYLGGAERALHAAMLADPAAIDWQIAYPLATGRPLAVAAWDNRALVASGEGGIIALAWTTTTARPPTLLSLLEGLPAAPQNLVSGEDRLWMAGEGLLWQVDVHDPAAPALAWALSLPGAGGGLAALPETGHLAVAAGRCGLWLLEVSGESPRIAGWWRGGTVEGVAAVGQTLAALEEGRLTLLQVEPGTSATLPLASAPWPPDGAVGIAEEALTLRWEPPPEPCDAWRYEVWLAAGDGSLARLAAVEGARATAPALPPGVEVTWRVDTIAASGEVRMGSLWHFQTGPLATGESSGVLALPIPEAAQETEPVPGGAPAVTGLDARQLLPALVGGILLEVALVGGLLLWWRRQGR
ncbi:MAG: hypothetical protein HPY64_03855 [Anaerolineae bacterium]|nr:hypothetical protein [Anaerolineae bacterium]